MQKILLRYGSRLLLAGSVIFASLLWLLPFNKYKEMDGFPGCDIDGLAASEGILFFCLAQLAGAVILGLLDAGSEKRHRLRLLAVSAGFLVVYLARAPTLLHEAAWTRDNCSVGMRVVIPGGQPTGS